MIGDRRTLRRGIIVVVAALVVATALTTATTGVLAQEQPIQETEPNDAPAGGTPLTTAEASGTLDPAGIDYDWYVTRAEQGETIEATATFDIPGSTSNFEMTIIAPNGTQIAGKTDVGNQIGTAVVAPETGTYYIGVQSTVVNTEIGLSGTIPYTMTVSPVMNSTPPSYTGSPDLADQPRSESEPNNARVGGADVRGAPINGSLDPTGDSDWFAIQADAGQRIEALATYEGIGNETQPSMEITAANGSTIAYSDTYNISRLQVATVVQQPGTYYIHLEALDAPGPMPYTLTAFSAGQSSNASTDTGAANGTTATSAGNNTSAAPAPSNGSVKYPPGYAASGITDPARAAEQHVTALAAQNSYALTLNATSPSGDTQTSVAAAQRANISSQQAYTEFNISAQTGRIATESYYNESTGYTRTNTSFASEGPRYNVSRQPFSVTYNSTATNFQRYLGNASYGAAQPVERNGETLLRYEATELTDAAAFLNMPLGDITADNVSAFNATVLVDQNGLIRSFSYSATYTAEGTTTTTLDLRITDLNETTVSEPDWLDEAKANVSGQTTPPATEQATPATVQTTTATTTPTPTPTATATLTPSATDSTPSGTNAVDGNASGPNTSNGTIVGNTTGGSGSAGPGFGIGVAVVAMLVAGLLAVRQRER